ncbi:MAG: hypothetical protein MZW92_49725 [Comamonadaceae bacterium]|nr:hypothetical protein [Comamonadaceae bacterium]
MTVPPSRSQEADDEQRSTDLKRRSFLLTVSLGGAGAAQRRWSAAGAGCSTRARRQPPRRRQGLPAHGHVRNCYRATRADIGIVPYEHRDIRQGFGADGSRLAPAYSGYEDLLFDRDPTGRSVYRCKSRLERLCAQPRRGATELARDDGPARRSCKRSGLDGGRGRVRQPVAARP